MVFGSSITISTSDSLDIDNTYIETPTVTAIPVNIILVHTLMRDSLGFNSHCFQPSDSRGMISIAYKLKDISINFVKMSVK